MGDSIILIILSKKRLLHQELYQAYAHMFIKCAIHIYLYMCIGDFSHYGIYIFAYVYFINIYII